MIIIKLTGVYRHFRAYKLKQLFVIFNYILQLKFEEQKRPFRDSSGSNFLFIQ